MRNDISCDLSAFALSKEELFAPMEASASDGAGGEASVSFRRAVARKFFARPSNCVILALLLLVLLFAFVYPQLSEYDRFANLLVPESKHLSPREACERYGFALRWLLGSGANGESVFDAVWNGAGISLALALLCGVINMTLGIFAGLCWGTFRKADNILLALYHTVGNVPYILLVSVVLMLLRPGFWTMVFALTVTGWLGIAYEIRTQVLIIRDREYNLASRCLGSSAWRIMYRNILPHLTSVIVTLAAAEIPSYLSYEVFLSYIGIGIPEMSLGRLIYESERAMFTPGWQLEFWSPVAVACVVTVVLYVAGQRLGDASDPKTHH